MSDSKLLCTTCGNVAEPKRMTRGSLLIEIVLWLWLVPSDIVVMLNACAVGEFYRG